MRDHIKRVYLGLPKQFMYSIFWVARRFRTNNLSHLPGGSDIIVEYQSGKILGYDWIKFPSRYVMRIFHHEFTNKDPDFGMYDSFQQLVIIKKEIFRIFARIYEKGNFHEVNFEEVWNADKDDQLPWVKLEVFEQLKQNGVNIQAQDRYEMIPPIPMFDEYNSEELIDEVVPDPKLSSKASKNIKRILSNSSNKKKEKIKRKNRNENLNSLEHIVPKEMIRKLRKLK